MTAFRLFLLAFWVGLTIYTGLVAANHGLGLFEIFFGDMAKLTWPGQFNLDFFGFLLLSGLWLAWRHDFGARGLALGVIGTLGGMGFLAPYLLFVSLRAGGDMRVVLMGPRRAAG